MSDIYDQAKVKLKIKEAGSAGFQPAIGLNVLIGLVSNSRAGKSFTVGSTAVGEAESAGLKA